MNLVENENGKYFSPGKPADSKFITHLDDETYTTFDKRTGARAAKGIFVFVESIEVKVHTVEVRVTYGHDSEHGGETFIIKRNNLCGSHEEIL